MSHQATTEQAWNEYRHRLMYFIRSKVGVVEDAEDILSDVFTTLAKKVDSSEVPDNVASWLYRVTRNKIVDYYRTKKSFEELPEDLVSEDEEATVISQFSMCLLPMIMALPESYQQPLILSEIQGRKYKELTAELGLSLPAVKSRIIRGREKLYKSMLACCTIQRDTIGNIMSYEQKKANSCDGCDSE